MLTAVIVTIIVLAYVECEMLVYMATVARGACSLSVGED